MWPGLGTNARSLVPTNKDIYIPQKITGQLGWAMVLGSFRCRGVLLHLLIVGHGPAVIAAGAERVGCIFIYFSSSFHF